MQRPSGVPEGAVWNASDERWVVGDPKGSGTVETYRGDGRIAARWHCIDGVMHGEYVRFHDDGSVSQRGQLERGRMVGVASAFRARDASSEPFPDVPEAVVRIDTTYDDGEAVGMAMFDADGTELAPEAVAFLERMDELREAHEAEPSEPWTPTLATPPRPDGVPSDAEFAHADSYHARWEHGDRIDGEKHGVWRYWAVNGALVMETALERGRVSWSKTYRAGGRIATHLRAVDGGASLYEAFAPDGTLAYAIRYGTDDVMEIGADDILEERIFQRDGQLRRAMLRSTDDAGERSLREYGAGERLVFENVAVAGGRELRFHDDGRHVLTVFAADEPSRSSATVHGGTERTMSIDATGIDADTG